MGNLIAKEYQGFEQIKRTDENGNEYKTSKIGFTEVSKTKNIEIGFVEVNKTKIKF